MFSFGKRRLLAAIATFAFIALIINLVLLSGLDVTSGLKDIRIPGLKKKPWHSGDSIGDTPPRADNHPISILMEEADQAWRAYENSRSTTFRQTVSKYRSKYGRHPPPGFKDWYGFARKKNVHNIDDFEQIMDDIRPFWAIEPWKLRNLAANMGKDGDIAHASVLHIRDHKVVKISNNKDDYWRPKEMTSMLQSFIKYLPDLDIAMNRLDQPRVVVPWADMQDHLNKELESRRLAPETVDEYTLNQPHVLNLTKVDDGSHQEDAGWFPFNGKQYMEVASAACPPESHARKGGSSTVEAEKAYKNRLGGVITNFNLSSDLCTIGPEIQDKHGLLYAGSTIAPTKRLVPIFGECKVNVNSDILFPANMYWKHDDRYDYNGKHDDSWEKKKEVMLWRGVTSGGTQNKDNWRTMHRQRLVLMTSSESDKEAPVVVEQPEQEGEYENYRQFSSSEYSKNYTDIGFTETTACVPDCNFYEGVWDMKEQVETQDQFRYKYLVDVDGHSFSGRWHAFLESKSLGFKATIFREWHDSRLFAWRHFVPMDNRYDDLWTLLTYFTGYDGSGPNESADKRNEKVLVASHQAEGKRIADQGREWAKKVLRRDDIEIYMFRLMLEYARVVDDNRDRIGYSGDGSELDKYDGVSSADEIPR